MKNLTFLLLMFIALTSYAQIPTNGLVAYYPFNGNANDESGNGNNGTVYGTTLTTDRYGNTNKAYIFNGAGTYIEVLNSISLKSIETNQTITFSAWINIFNWDQGIFSIIDKYNPSDDAGWNLELDNRIGIAYHLNLQDYSSCQYSYNFNTWYHIVVSYSSNQQLINFYINGTLLNSHNFTQQISSSENSLLFIGYSPSGPDEYAYGKIDDIRIYNRVLNDNEIQALYNEKGNLDPKACPEISSFNYEGQTYNTSKIGTQCWMKENLNTTKYRNGDAISNVTDNTTWNNLLSPAYSNYNNDVTNPNTYGRLYNWYAVNDSRNLCPLGWHIPTNGEWTILTDYMGGASVAGGKMKDKTTSYWAPPNTGATDLFGFTALPGGLRGNGNGSFSGMSNYCSLWSSTEASSDKALARYLVYYDAGVISPSSFKKSGFSVRCVKDECTSCIPPLQIIYPKINLNKAIINAGESIAISGKDFKATGTVNINIQGPAGFSQSIDNISIDSQGGFSYTYSTTTKMLSGTYNISAIDKITGLSAAVKQFTIISTIIQTNYLAITSPIKTFTVDVNENFLVEWKDKMIKANCYTIAGSKRNYKYKIELYDNNSSTWKTLQIIEGQDYIDNWVSLSYSTSIVTAGTEYRIRISDFYNISNTQTTPVFTVSNVTQTGNLKVNLKWDYSFPQPSVPVQGVAADGTGRIFLNISKINNSQGPDISNVSVTLSDVFNGTNETKLGKVKVATQTSVYSSEANGISSITANDNTVMNSNSIFWYVAPDDFTGADPNDLTSSYRYITATFTVNYTNSSSEIITKKIMIVRPPLMMVHGLGSDEHAWDNFRSNSLGYEMKFTEDFRFNTKIAVHISPDASFKTNALSMTIGFQNPTTNSFQGVICDIRNKGFAANRVDYLCHSMGGCVLRSIYDNYYQYFTATTANKRYKNYENGYVNKVIMIGTPNNSSPWADIINRYVGDLPLLACGIIQSWYGFSGSSNKPLPLMFIQPEDPNAFIWSYKPTDAVKNLQIDYAKGGVNFGTTNTKAHLIAGDFLPYEQYNTNGLIPQQLISKVNEVGDETLQEFLNYFLKIAINKETDPLIKQELLNIFKSKIKPVAKALNFLDKMSIVMDVFNVGTFIPESDLVVSVGSQLAGYPRPSSNGESNVSVYDNFIGHAFFRPELNNLDIGNRVDHLLNSSINSSLFNNIPATIGKKKTGKGGLDSLNNNSIISKSDTNKLQIIYPQNNITAFADSTFHIKIKIKDTIKLESVEVNFQNKTYYVDSIFPGTIDMNLQINNNVLDNHKLLLVGFYNYPDSGRFVYDQKIVNISTKETLTDFSINPKILFLFKDQIKYANYNCTYQNFTTSTGTFSPEINVIVDDTSIVKYDLHSTGFKGIENGETFAIISYKGLSDTLYFVVGNSTTYIPNYKISGNLTYDNTVNTPMNNSIVYLKNEEGVVIDSTNTDNSGYYSFNVLNGKYIIKAKTSKKFGGADPTDGLLISKNFVKLYNFKDDLCKQAADVTKDQHMNSTDALIINKRFVKLISSFKSGDWLFQSDTLTINNKDTVYDIKALCYGDVNGSRPATLAKLFPAFDLNTQGSKKVEANKVFDIPIKVSQDLEIGAIGLLFSIQNSKFKITNVSSKIDGLIYNITDKGINIAWSANFKPIDLKMNDTLLIINARIESSNLKQENSDLLSLEPGSVLADYEGLAYSGNLLTIPIIRLEDCKSSDCRIVHSCYPNPFTQQTNIFYQLQENANVNISIYDVLGNKISVLTDEYKIAGNYNLIFDAKKLPEGMYYYKIIAGNMEGNGKIILMK